MIKIETDTAIDSNVVIVEPLAERCECSSPFSQQPKIWLFFSGEKRFLEVEIIEKIITFFFFLAKLEEIE